LWWLIREEHNAWIHLTVTIVLIPVCFWLRLSLIEWTLILVCIGLVLAMELVNSAIERMADKISPKRDPDIGKIKDLSAGAVLISSIAAAIVALIILVPKFIQLF
jgi:diacylglycerol kinase